MVAASSIVGGSHSGNKAMLLSHSPEDSREGVMLSLALIPYKNAEETL